MAIFLAQWVAPGEKSEVAWRVSSDQLTSLSHALAAAPAHQRQGADAVLLILLTGCRMGEILSLRWKDVKPDRLVLRQAKTGPRDVWLNAPAKDLLIKIRHRSTGPILFPKRGTPRQPMTTITCWPSLRTAAGLPKDIRIHDLRHTYASHAVLSSESLALTGSLLGHKSPRSTARYTHLDPGQTLTAAEEVQRRIAGWLQI